MMSISKTINNIFDVLMCGSVGAIFGFGILFLFVNLFDNIWFILFFAFVEAGLITSLFLDILNMYYKKKNEQKEIKIIKRILD